MTQVTWLIHSQLIDRLTRYNSESIIDVIKSQEHNVLEITEDEILNRRFDSLKGVSASDGPLIPYGSIQFIEALMKSKFIESSVQENICQQIFGMSSNFHTSRYRSEMPRDWFLSNPVVFVPFKLLTEQFNWLGASMKSTKLFIRPDSGRKTFTGQVIDQLDHRERLEGLEQISGIVPTTMVMVAPATKILGEFRFLIVDGKVITGSEYRWDDRLDVRIDFPDECKALADIVAAHEWQADTIYTCDIALTPTGAKIIELNGFSSAGLYACNLKSVIDSVSKSCLLAFEEYKI